MTTPLLKLDIVAFPVSDWQRSKTFYAETLGLPVAAYLGDEIGWMEFGERNCVHLAIRRWDGPEPFPEVTGGGVAVFGVPDAYTAVAELRRKGVRCEDVIAIPQTVTYADFYDPDGNRLQVVGPPPEC